MSAPIETTRMDRFRQLWRMVLRESRERNRWRKIIRFRLWMPVVLQIILVVGLAWYTNGRFPGFLNANNINQLLILALPLIVSVIRRSSSSSPGISSTMVPRDMTRTRSHRPLSSIGSEDLTSMAAPASVRFRSAL